MNESFTCSRCFEDEEKCIHKDTRTDDFCEGFCLSSGEGESTRDRLDFLQKEIKEIVEPMTRRDECIKLLKGIIEDIENGITNDRIFEDINQYVISISVGLDFSERGNGDFEDYYEYGWCK